MQLAHVPLASLILTSSNMRHEKKAPDVSDILPSIRQRGILQPLLVRASGDQFDVVAGRRRCFAARIVAEETGEAQDVPCAIMDPTDDADALEASLIENLARRDPDEMQQYTTFSKLFKEGRSVAEIGQTFGMTDKQVEQRLALGNLIPAIRDLYTAEELDVRAVQALTLATPAQQKAWMALHKKKKAPMYAHMIRSWLFEKGEISTSAALFELVEYNGDLIGDLFEEDRYFGDVSQFWELQNTAIAARVEALKKKGWAGVEVIEPGSHWQSYQFERVTKKAGGKVYLIVSRNGAVDMKDGYLPRAEAKRAAKRQQGEGAAEAEVSTSSRPEVTQGQNDYIEAHRQAAIRAALVKNPSAAFRLLVAHLLGRSVGLSAQAQDFGARGEALAQSVGGMAPHQAFEKARVQALDALGFAGKGRHSVTGRYQEIEPTFAALMAMDNTQVMQIAAVVMAECLDAGSRAGEAAGKELGVDLVETWQADDLFFEQLRDKEIIGNILEEVAGKDTADANLTGTGKVKKQIIRDCLTGTNGRERVAWLPRWLRSEIGTYSERGGVRLAREIASKDFTDDFEDDEDMADFEG